MWRLSLRKNYGFLAKLFKKSPKTNPEKFKQPSKQVSDHITMLEVFLFYPALDGKRKQRFDCDCLFNHNFDVIPDKIASLPIFLDQPSALQYRRYLGESYGILRAYVQDIAVAGRNEELYLKNGFLSLPNIHGLLLPAEEGSSYVRNPRFNERILTIA